MATSVQQAISLSGGTVLTVGAGMEFATLGDACKAAAAGDTIAVQAGTYVNDFATVSCALKIVSLGGMVNEVATIPPPNGKALLTVDANLAIQGFSFTGGSDGSPDGNVAGIRLEGGNLAVSYCYFHDMQEGLLAGPNAAASVTIDRSAFARNGTGDGYTHNLYVGAVGSLTITNSYFTAANVGHEIKSRAAVTNISNNVIVDGPTGTASYDIDVPNAGVATITNNVIEKGPMASNWDAIHYGGETQYAWAQNALKVSGNTILNDLGANGVAVLNQSNYNGLTVSADISHNSLYGFDPTRIVVGTGIVTANTTLATKPAISSASPYAGLPVISLAAAPGVLNLTNGNHAVSGGITKLTINDTAGSNTIGGGSGGINVAAACSWDLISTQAGAADAITLGGRNNTVHSAGADHIAAPGYYEEVDVTGSSTITGAGFNTYGLNGAGEKLTASGSGFIHVGSAGNASVTGTAGDFNLTVASGGRVVISDQAAAAPPNDSTATVNGAAAGMIANSGAIGLTLGDAGATVQAGTGNVSVACGAGADGLGAGSGSATFTLGSGADRVVFGSGTATATAGSGVDTYVSQSGQAGRDTINGFRQGHDVLSFQGFAGSAIKAGSLTGGGTVLTLTDGTIITLAGVSLPGYAPPTIVGSPGSAGGGSGGGAGTPPLPILSPAPAASGAIVLAGSGHTVSGGTSQLHVTDLVGGNTIAGGSGGLLLTAGDADLVTTLAQSTSTITLARYDTLSGAGADHVTAAGCGNVIAEAAGATLALLGGGASVTGGAGLVTLTDLLGGDTIVGGAGGLSATLAGQYDNVTTASAAADSITLAGRSTLLSQGTDHILVQGGYNQVTATGAASITAGAGGQTYVLDGADSLTTSGGGLVTVGGAAAVGIASAGLDDLGITKLAGGTVSITESVAGGSDSLTVAGGAATIGAASGAYAGVRASVAANATVTAGGGNMTLTGGLGQDVFNGGSGQLSIALGHADTVSLGAGAITVQGGTADTFLVPQDSAGTLVIMNWSSLDSIATPGAAHPQIASQTVLSGSTWLTTNGGATIELVGISHFG